MERLMHYVWQHRLMMAADMVTTAGERVEVIDPGLLNTDAGPDFFNAKVRIADRVWCGNVEMHVRASDWHRHGHDGNPAYNSVILHVVGSDDCSISRPDGQMIPQLVMQCAPDFNRRYCEMVDAPADRLACFNEIKDVPQIYVSDCITAMAYERLYEKSERLLALMERLGGRWPEAVYVTMARALGFGLNSQAMEQLALNVPLRVLLKHRDNPYAVEGLLFGQAGLLTTANDPDSDGVHLEELNREYEFMRHKFALPEPPPLGWRMARTRPQNFPHRRIAALAAMVTEGFGISSEMCELHDLQSARDLFAEVRLPYYWQRRYTFGKAGRRISEFAFSSATADSLVINVAIPAMHAYGSVYGLEEVQQRAFELLEQLPPENNSITRLFASAGIKCRDAFTSQALIQLRKAYCEPRKCLYCRLGHRFLSQKAKNDRLKENQ